MNKTLIVVNLILLGLIVFLSLPSGKSDPSGGDITAGNSSRAPSADPESVPAQAGNVTNLNIQGFSSTRAWQGYYGNVTGEITLGDSLGNTLYDWTLTNPRGQVYASMNDSVQWQNTQCFNYTAAGNLSIGSAGETAGDTNQFGMNLTQLESNFNIREDDADGVNETFSYFGPGGHRQFYTSNLEFSEGECRSTQLFDSAGGQNDKFHVALLYEPVTTSVIFSSLIEYGGADGFDGNTYDFQMLVLEDGHGTDTDTTTYYFYVELE